MRTENSIKNITISVFSQIIVIILGFVSRKVFLDNLGVEYLGVNGLLTNVLSILVLAESGIGITIVYNLYKPLAEGNKKKITALIQLYKKAYTILAFAVFIVSLALYPFLGSLMKDGESIPEITTVYFIFVAKNVISYLNAHKWSLINADQKGYILSRVNLVFQVITTAAKIVILVLTQNYVLYLLIELFIYTGQNILVGKIVNDRYPYIRTKVKYSIDEDTRCNIVKNVKAMFLHNIGGYLVNGTDNILISKFISVAAVGLYSNYTMVIGQLSSLVKPILGGVGASVGNLIATEDREKNYSVFKTIYLMNFWIYSLCVIFLYNVLEPFIDWYFGKGYLLNRLTFTVILINFYLEGMRTAIATFKNKAGLFVQDRYAPLMEGLINLVSSLILIKYLGLAGVFVGTTISTLSIIFWNQPRIVYKYLFKKPVGSYFEKYALYAFLTTASCFITSSICNFFTENNFISLVARGLVSLIIPNMIYLMVFFKTKEFQYLLDVAKGLLLKIRRVFEDRRNSVCQRT